MEISPISGIRALPVLKTRQAESELSALPDIEELARIGDETYTPSDEKHASVAEEDPDEFSEAEDLDEEERAMTPMIQSEADGAISFFA